MKIRYLHQMQMRIRISDSENGSKCAWEISTNLSGKKQWRQNFCYKHSRKIFIRSGEQTKKKNAITHCGYRKSKTKSTRMNRRQRDKFISIDTLTQKRASERARVPHILTTIAFPVSFEHTPVELKCKSHKLRMAAKSAHQSIQRLQAIRVFILQIG